MIKLEKYTGTKTYMFPSGELATPERMAEMYPAAALFTFVIETDEHGEVAYAVDNLSGLRSIRGIDPSLGEEEAIQMLEDLRNAPQPSYEESAEYQLKLREVEALETANNLALFQMVLEVDKGAITETQFAEATGIEVSEIKQENIARITSLKAKI